jgi:hypothetical protein
MHLEEQYKVYDKRQKSMIAQQFMPVTTRVVVGKNPLVHTLKTTRIQCAASFESQNTTPTTWAWRLERENSGFSV